MGTVFASLEQFFGASTDKAERASKEAKGNGGKVGSSNGATTAAGGKRPSDAEALQPPCSREQCGWLRAALAQSMETFGQHVAVEVERVN